jgi:large subunit ribosomal protein L30e
MNEKKLAKLLKEAAVSSKLKTGYKEVMQYMKGTKLIVAIPRLS